MHKYLVAVSRVASFLAVLGISVRATAQEATTEPAKVETPGISVSAEAVQDTALKTELTRISEAIIEAIRVGDKPGLEKYLTPDMVLINRDGNEYTRKDLVDELVPMREGYDLRFKILESRVIARGEAVLFTFLLDEYLTIFGQNVSTVYRNHFLFHRIDGAWKLALYTYWEKPSTPPVVPLDPASLDALVGTYELAPGKWTTHIAREGNRLVYRREGGQARELLPMAGDRFYLKGVEAEYFFERDASGKAVALVFRRNWIDLRLRRVP